MHAGMCAPSGDCPPRLPVAPQPLGAARRMPAVLNRTAGAQAGVRAPPGRPRVARSAWARRRGRKGGRRGRAGRLRRRAGRAGSELVVTVKKMTTLDTTASASCAQKLTQPMRLRAAAPRCSRARPGQQGAAARTAACRVARRASAGAQRTGWPRPPSRWCPRPQRGRPWLPPAPTPRGERDHLLSLYVSTPANADSYSKASAALAAQRRAGQRGRACRGRAAGPRARTDCRRAAGLVTA